MRPGSEASLFYRVTMVLLRGLLHSGFRCETRGLENLPADGALLAANHVSFYDPEFICAVCKGYDITWLGKKELFVVPVLGPVLTWLRTIPLNQGGPDVKAFREALRRMERGNVVGIFPQGGLSRPGQARDPQPGVAVLAHKAGRPVVPVWIGGTQPLIRWEGWRPIPSRVVIRIGEPLDPPRGARLEAAERLAFTEGVMDAIEALAADQPITGARRTLGSRA